MLNSTLSHISAKCFRNPQQGQGFITLEVWKLQRNLTQKSNTAIANLQNGGRKLHCHLPSSVCWELNTTFHQNFVLHTEIHWEIHGESSESSQSCRTRFINAFAPHSTCRTLASEGSFCCRAKVELSNGLEWKNCNGSTRFLGMRSFL